MEDQRCCMKGVDFAIVIATEEAAVAIALTYSVLVIVQLASTAAKKREKKIM